MDLDTTYSLVLQDVGLVLRRRKFAPLLLQPTTVDGFVANHLLHRRGP
jgi:hypothetical protein